MRIDVWLWAVRLFKSRSASSSALRAGRIRVDGLAVKASYQIRVGDRIAWWDGARRRDVAVTALIPKRVGAPEAVKAYVDLSDPMPTRAAQLEVGVRDRGAGRPTKRERRDLDRLRGRQR